MDVIVIVQARMGSSRMPGKSLYPFLGRPSLEHLLRSVLQIFSKSNVVIATSKEPEDDPLVDFGQNLGIEVFRGDLENVASRFYAILKNKSVDAFIRLSGDSPLFDFRILQNLKSAAEHSVRVTDSEALPDFFYSTVPSKTYPSGMNAELVSKNLFITNYKKFTSPDHFEHVTRFFYENMGSKIVSPSSGIHDPFAFKFSLDTPRDVTLIQFIFEKIGPEHWRSSLAQKVELARSFVLTYPRVEDF